MTTYELGTVMSIFGNSRIKVRRHKKTGQLQENQSGKWRNISMDIYGSSFRKSRITKKKSK